MPKKKPKKPTKKKPTRRREDFSQAAARIVRQAEEPGQGDAEAAVEFPAQKEIGRSNVVNVLKEDTMKMPSRSSSYLVPLVLCVLAASGLLSGPLLAQNPEMQQKVSEIKQAMAKNKQALAQYTWVETISISLKGEEKKQEHNQVRLGPDGKPQKSSLDQPDSSDDRSGGRRRRVKEHVVAKKKEEYKEYADKMKDLIQQYIPPDKDMLQQAYQQGNIMMGPVAGTTGQYRLVISNFIKQGDNMTLVVDKTQKDLVRVSIATYMDEPSDAVRVDVQFSALPGGPNHVASQTINGVRKKMTIAVQNSNYQHL